MRFDFYRLISETSGIADGARCSILKRKSLQKSEALFSRRAAGRRVKVDVLPLYRISKFLITKNTFILFRQFMKHTFPM